MTADLRERERSPCPVSPKIRVVLSRPGCLRVPGTPWSHAFTELRIITAGGGTSKTLQEFFKLSFLEQNWQTLVYISTGLLRMASITDRPISSNIIFMKISDMLTS